MKKRIAIVLCLCLLLPLVGCGKQTREITCADVVAAYEAAGYSVSHRDYPEEEYGYLCMVRIEEEDGDSIEFHFHETAEKAQAEAKERQWNVLLWLFSVIYSDPTWLETETYQNIEIEYDDDDLYKPFKQLVSSSSAAGYSQDAFFSTDLLAEYALSGMPVPKLENSRLNENILYCNLGDEEYRTYVGQLVEYLGSREDIYYLGSYCSSGLLGEIAPYDVYSYIPEGFAAESGPHWLAFSTTEELTKNGYLSDPIRIYISRGEETLGLTGFTYNTKIKLSDTARGAEFDPCYRNHTFDEGTPYIVPGMNRSITVYQCVHCGATEQSEYLDSRESYAVTVTQGRNMILRNNWNQTVAWDIDSMHAGGMMEITVRNSAQGRVELLVNGEKIPVLRAEENTQTFGFIMPPEDVEIQIIVVSEDAGE